MTKHTRPEDLPALLGLCLAVVTGELPAATASGSFIKITPSGRVTTRDGRSYSFDPEKLAARAAGENTEVAVDTDHSIALRAMRGEAGNTIGYAKEIEARPDGTYARVDWLDGAQAVLKARTHRYVSPTFHHDASGEATWLHSISLVPVPALDMPAIAAAMAPGSSDTALATLSAVAAALGLPASADQAALLAAIGSMAADAVPKALHEGAVSALGDATTRLATLAAETRSREVEELIEGALKATKIVPFERPHYLALCSTDAGLTTVKALLATMLPRFAGSGLDGRRAPGQHRPESVEQLAARASAYREERHAAGVTITTAEAVRHVRNVSA